MLDLHTGMLHEDVIGDRRVVRRLRFIWMARPPSACAARARRPALDLHRRRRRDPARRRPGWTSARMHESPGRIGTPRATAIGVGRTTREVHVAPTSVERWRLDTAPEGGPTGATRLRHSLDADREPGFERMLVEHRPAWARRWEDADIEIAGDDALQHAVRFALST